VASPSAATLSGVLGRIIFFNEENHYTIAELRVEVGRGVPSAPSKDETVTITNPIPEPRVIR